MNGSPPGDVLDTDLRALFDAVRHDGSTPRFDHEGIASAAQRVRRRRQRMTIGAAATITLVAVLTSIGLVRALRVPAPAVPGGTASQSVATTDGAGQPTSVAGQPERFRPGSDLVVGLAPAWAELPPSVHRGHDPVVALAPVAANVNLGQCRDYPADLTPSQTLADQFVSPDGAYGRLDILRLKTAAEANRFVESFLGSGGCGLQQLPLAADGPGSWSAYQPTDQGPGSSAVVRVVGTDVVLMTARDDQSTTVGLVGRVVARLAGQVDLTDPSRFFAPKG